MAFDLTEVEEFTEPLTVPEGADWMDLAAETIQDLAQGLANRTRSLLARAALKAVQNTFDVGQLFAEPNGETALIRATKGPHDQPSRPANPWKRILTGPTNDGSAHVSLYIGDGTEGYAAIAINAWWRASDATPKWRQDNNTRPSVLVVLLANGLEVKRKEAGEADWTSWDAENVGLSADYLLGQNAIIQNDVAIFGDFVFANDGGQGKQLTSSFNLRHCSGDVRLHNGAVKSLTGDRVVWALRVPTGDKFGTLQVMHVQTTAVGDRFTVTKRTGAVWSGSITAPSNTTVQTLTGAAATGTYVKSFDLSALSLDWTTDDVELSWEPLGFSPGGEDNRVVAIRMANWRNKRPRNW